MRLLAVLLIVVAVGGAAASGLSSRVVQPEMATVTTRTTVETKPYAEHITLVIRRGGTLWRARMTFVLYRRNTVQIYRRSGNRWLLQGTVKLPTGGPLSYLGSASLTHAAPPDFVTSYGGGADWTPSRNNSSVHSRRDRARAPTPGTFRHRRPAREADCAFPRK